MSEVFFAIPTRGEIDWQIAAAITELGRELAAEPYFQVGHTSVAAQRNLICQAFLASDKALLFMLDDDVMPAGNAIALLSGLAHYDIVAAAVPIWRDAEDAAPCWAAFDRFQKPLSGEGLQTAAYVGTGCIAIRRRVIERFPVLPFFDDIRLGRHIPDDVTFCEQAGRSGFEIGVDFSVVCDQTQKVSLRRVLRLSERLTSSDAPR